MRRREFMVYFGGATAGWPYALCAQQPVIPTVGIVSSGSSEGFAKLIYALQEGLVETGYFEDQNVRTQLRWADGKYDALPQLAADLVQHQVAIIVAAGGVAAAQAAKLATSTVPIVFVNGADPVETGLVSSLSRPGANVTGISLINVDLLPKRLELIKEAVVGLSEVGVLSNSRNPVAAALISEVEKASQSIGLRPHFVGAGGPEEFEQAFLRLKQMRVGALLIINDPLFNSVSQHLAALAVRESLPAVYSLRDFAVAGGLIGFGPSHIHAYREAGIYAGRILRGEKPSELPVQRSTRFELVINLRTAKALGLTVPPALLARADEVIE